MVFMATQIPGHIEQRPRGSFAGQYRFFRLASLLVAESRN